MIDRRNFLKLSALGSLTLACPLLSRDGKAEVGRYEGPYWALVNAGGGWDPRFMFDPVAAGDQNRLYFFPGSVGNIQFADYPIDIAAFGLDTTQGYEGYLMTPRAFVERYGARMTVLNGVDTSTNNHDAGSRTIWSGTIPGDYPSFGALVAAAQAPDLPMAFVSGGGYDATSNLIPLARVTNPDVLAKLAQPNRINATDEGSDPYHTADTFSRIRAAQSERLARAIERHSLPRYARSMKDLQGARLGVADLSRLELPAALVDIPGSQLDDLERMERQAQFAVSAFRSGMAVSATINLGGFDTHGDHDRDQPRQITKLLAGIDFLMTEASAAGIADRLFVVVGSDFARGPLYNSDRDNAGKDHWPITSLFVMGPGVPGDRVIGATTADQRPIGVDPGTLAPQVEGGTKLTPEIVHRALRRLSGMGGMASDFPLPGSDLPLFG